mgnify:CR=1 FL=1
MHIGIPREVRALEGRIALIPEACAQLVDAGHSVSVEQGAGVLSGYCDADFIAAGASLADDARTLFDSAELIVKVKEPQPQELDLLKPGHRLFCYLHLAAYPALTRSLLNRVSAPPPGTGCKTPGGDTLMDASTLLDFIEEIERCLGREAIRNYMEMQPGDVLATWADATLLQTLTGYRPQTNVKDGIAAFVAWFRDYYRK